MGVGILIFSFKLKHALEFQIAAWRSMKLGHRGQKVKRLRGQKVKRLRLITKQTHELS